MQFIPNLIFIIALVSSFVYFGKNFSKIIAAINLGKPVNAFDNPMMRLGTMMKVAFGQSKMVVRPIPAILHFAVYIGFILINLEVLEIIIDGVFGTHRVMAPLFGESYKTMIGFFEFLALSVLLACVFFLIRRNYLKIKRFWNSEMMGWPQKDANTILYLEISFMSALLIMNGADTVLQQRAAEHYTQVGSFAISGFLTAPWLDNFSTTALIIIERALWWFHIMGIFFFLNYLYYSKHLHILFAFPNTFFSKLRPKGQFDNLAAVTQEVNLMMDPNADPYAAAPVTEDEPKVFGARDVKDLSRVQLLNAYTCTECGRCTSVCPANLTGKLLSPRKIMMSTRDRLEDIIKNKDTNKGTFVDDGKTLHDYISAEELWACTSCNGCTEACPINIDPLSIIVDMRRYLVMENSAAPKELNSMMSNIENNGAPWPFGVQDRLKWAEEL
jgi:heterodisulfide reductase subunit C